jgi:hypothetical protein
VLQIIYEVIISISSYGVGIVTALVAVRREHKKDVIERYEERADLWKKAHFNALINFIKPEKERWERALTNTNNSVNKLQTPGVIIEKDSNVGVFKIHLSFMENEEFQEHIRAGYIEKYSSIVDVKEKEKNYEPRVEKCLNGIMHSLDEIKKEIPDVDSFESPYIPMARVINPELKVPIYYKHNILNYIIEYIEFPIEEFYICDYGIFDSTNNQPLLSYRNRKLSNEEIEKFKKIIMKISEENEEELKSLISIRKEINELYEVIDILFDNIINDFETGLGIKGSCRRCEMIKDGRDKKNLMPI